MNDPERKNKPIFSKPRAFENTKVIFDGLNGFLSIAISKNDKMIAIGDWDTGDGKVRTFSMNEEIDNDGNDNNNKWNLKFEKEEKMSSYPIRLLVFSDDGKYLLSCSHDEPVILSDAKTLKKIKTFDGHTGSVYSVLFKSENEIVSCSWYHEIIVWDINSGNQIATVDTGNNCGFLALNPNKEMIVVGQIDGNIIAYESTIVNNTLKKITDLPKIHTNWINSLCFTPNGKMLISFSDDTTINVYEVLSNKSFNHLRTLTGHTNAIYGGAISPDGEIIASGSVDNTIKLWNINTGNCVKIIKSHTSAVGQLAFSHSGSFLASVSDDCTIRITTNESVARFRNEKVHVMLSLAKSAVFIPFDICQDYLVFVNAMQLKHCIY